MGMQDYLHDYENKNINDTWALSDVQFDKDILLDTIMLDAGQLGINTTNPLQYYRQCDMWWKKWQNTFQKWWEVQEKEYEPLWNTDRYEESHDDIVDTGTDNLTTYNQEIMDDDTTSSLSGEASGSSLDSTSGTVTNSVSAFDAGNNLVTHDSQSSNSQSEGTTNSNSSSTGTGTDDRTTTNNGTQDRDTTNDRDLDHSLHAWGNIGVMSSQDLYTQELKVRFINLYEHAAAIFIKEMTCAVW